MMTDYKAALNERYWKYQECRFPNGQRFFDRLYAPDGRPPVFITSKSWRNIIINPTSSQQEIDKLLALVPEGEKHKWFRSMNSSQALGQSILGNLAINNSLHYLSEIKDDEGQDLFSKVQISSNNFTMEHKVNYLGEPRPTSLDGFVSGDYQIAIECKFTEARVGTCSRPRLKSIDSNYESEYCNGSYSIQSPRKERCSLTEIGVLYWRFVPKLFNWKNDEDIPACPLYKNYQLVRNILAAGIRPDGAVLLIMDMRY